MTKKFIMRRFVNGSVMFMAAVVVAAVVLAAQIGLSFFLPTWAVVAVSLTALFILCLLVTTEKADGEDDGEDDLNTHLNLEP